MPTQLRKPRWSFLALNAVVWIAMVIILVVVPDWLESWFPLEVARVIGWAVACALWVVAVERHWQRRVGAFARFFLQLLLWVSAALVAIWVSDQFRIEL
ncbi:MAG TPA: hypothetical protein VFO19_18020 [Vicinamibacterales bacterium]|nr:hypothetical protein [Vicinamibacterales bacterium]